MTHLIPPLIKTPASEIRPGERYCICCGRELRGTVAWLELDQRTHTYHHFGGVPADDSQGWFPFGLTCARAAVAKAQSKAA